MMIGPTINSRYPVNILHLFGLYLDVGSEYEEENKRIQDSESPLWQKVSGQYIFYY